MSEKLTWVELRQQVADRAGIKEAEAGQFLNALVHQMQEGLKTDRMVRLSGLGTFRVQAVAPRRSVNVTTGEAFTIEGYNKLAFSAEAGAKELIESAGITKSALEDDITPIKKLGAQADEIVDLLAELGQMPNTEEEEEGADQGEGRREKVEKPETENEEGVEAEGAGQKAEEVEKAEVVEKAEEVETVVEKKPGTGAWRWLRDVLITIIILLLLIVGGIFLLREGLSDLFEQLANTDAVEQVEGNQVEGNQVEGRREEVEKPETENEEGVEAESTGQKQGIGNEKQETGNEKQGIGNEKQEIGNEKQGIGNEKRVYTDFITTEEMHQDSRLAWMAYRYYGNKDLWVFIYEANMDHLSNPDKIDVGTPIRVPRLSKELKDVHNAETQKIIAELKSQFGK